LRYDIPAFSPVMAINTHKTKRNKKKKWQNKKKATRRKETNPRRLRAK